MTTLLILIVLATAASSSASNPGLVAGLIGSGQSGTPHRSSGSVGNILGVMPEPTEPQRYGVPQAQVGSVLIGGRATWYCHDGSGGYPESRCTRGYEPGDLIAAAGSELPWGKGERVVVSRGDKSVIVEIVDSCLCQGSRVIDLSAAAFERLGSLGEGVIRVEVTSAADIELPPTDTVTVVK